MAIREICTYPNSVLRKETKVINVFDDNLKALISDMFETMYAKEGIGLAAPQIGVSLKAVVIDYHGEKYTLINPEITAKEGCVKREEGCLSFPGFYEKVDSPEKIAITYFDENGEQHNEEIEGFKAAVFCHETDHLNGRLLIDRVSPIKRQFIKKKIAKATEDKDR